MYSFISTVLTLALALHPALAGIYTTNPVSSTTGTGGQVLTVKWADDGNKPALADVGPCSIDLYTGSVYKQVKLQNLAASVDVSKTSSVSTTINPTSGENGTYYFVRFTSLGLKDTTNPQFNYQAYSAKFSLSEMTGKFDATVLADLSATNGSTVISTPPVAAASSASVSKASSSATAPAAANSKSAAMPNLASPAGAGLIAGAIGIGAYFAI